jgi:hypothetical protein
MFPPACRGGKEELFKQLHEGQCKERNARKEVCGTRKAATISSTNRSVCARYYLDCIINKLSETWIPDEVTRILNIQDKNGYTAIMIATQLEKMEEFEEFDPDMRELDADLYHEGFLSYREVLSGYEWFRHSCRQQHDRGTETRRLAAHAHVEQAYSTPKNQRQKPLGNISSTLRSYNPLFKSSLKSLNTQR